jgi:hypothetical protein
MLMSFKPHLPREAPEHGKVGIGELILRRQVQPDLKQLERVRRRALEQGKHFGVHDALAGREPLYVARPVTRRGAEGIGVIDEAAPGDRNGFEAAMRVLREARDDVAVVHAPAVDSLEIHADVATGEGPCGP